jgi:hypothetical protein
MAKEKSKKVKSPEIGKVYRSAETGKFVSKGYATKHPKTTVKESFSKKTSSESSKSGSRTGGPKKA